MLFLSISVFVLYWYKLGAWDGRADSNLYNYTVKYNHAKIHWNLMVAGL